MNDIKVYEKERELGLEDQIRSQASVAFTAPVVKYDSTLEGKSIASIADIATAAVDDPDLFNVFSILVSTSWNRNDDIFNNDEVWAARKTPIFKPTNLEHDEKQMVGNIVDCWPVDEDFKLIADETDPSELPETFHLLVSSVIFRQWQDRDLKERAETLIAEIENGDKYVSMECIFRGFDYGVVDPDGNNHVVARNEDTAFLSQHLRCYGGRGVFQDHKIGRMLKNITFSGKGFVARPANPESIIFDKDHIFSFASAKNSKSLFLENNGVTNIEKQLLFEVNASDMEKDKMSDNQFLNDQINELKEALASAQEENKKMNDKLAEANVSAFETKITELEATVAEFEAKSAEITSQLEESVAKSEALQTELDEKSEAMKKIEGDMHKMKEDEKKKGRKVMMVKAGLSEDEAEAKLEVFAELSDEAFEAFIETVAGMHGDMEKKKKEEKDAKAMDCMDDKKKKEKAMKEYGMKEKASEEEVEAEASEEEIVEETEASEVVEAEADESTVAFSSETEDELSTARASLQEWVEKSILNK